MTRALIEYETVCFQHSKREKAKVSQLWREWVPKYLYWGYIGIMGKKMEATIMENQMEKKMEKEMEIGVI